VILLYNISHVYCSTKTEKSKAFLFNNFSQIFHRFFVEYAQSRGKPYYAIGKRKQLSGMHLDNMSQNGYNEEGFMWNAHLLVPRAHVMPDGVSAYE
ncbi:MAG: hypothetical protein IJY20_07310, partial [Clostridia bacterium]|nr:hypothetical protein [Clostridia bacterium]